jgi:drug/metabolite transporter (DMT)-like permease
MPLSIHDLAHHQCLAVHESDDRGSNWLLTHSNDHSAVQSIQIKGALSSNSGELVRDWCVQGRGIMLRSLWDVSKLLVVGLEVTPFTLGWTIFSLIAITVGTLYQKQFVEPVDVRVGNGIGLAGAAMVCLPFALLDSDPMIWHPQLMFAMGWAVLGLSLGGSSLFYLLVQRGAATSVTSLLYLVPPTTAAIAWLLFDEHISLVTIAGTLLCAMGVWFVVRPVESLQAKARF